MQVKINTSFTMRILETQFVPLLDKILYSGVNIESIIYYLRKKHAYLLLIVNKPLILQSILREMNIKNKQKYVLLIQARPIPGEFLRIYNCLSKYVKVNTMYLTEKDQLVVGTTNNKLIMDKVSSNQLSL